MSIPIVGKCFENAETFLDYLDDLSFNLWRPRFVTVHHTGAPDLTTWNGWQTRAKPVSDEQWLKNLAAYYGGLGWRSGPHFFITPAHICVLSPPDKRGVHAVSFNSVSWGVECVGDFDRENFAGKVKDNLIGALAAMHVAAGLQLDPYERGVRGLHFHRDDPLTSKTCPGRNVNKALLIAEVKVRIAAMTGGDHPDEQVQPSTVPRSRTGIVNTDGLTVRSDASGKAPALRALRMDTSITIVAEAMNGDTRWLSIAPGEWVAARFVDVKA